MRPDTRPLLKPFMLLMEFGISTRKRAGSKSFCGSTCSLGSHEVKESTIPIQATAKPFFRLFPNILSLRCGLVQKPDDTFRAAGLWPVLFPAQFGSFQRSIFFSQVMLGNLFNSKDFFSIANVIKTSVAHCRK